MSKFSMDDYVDVAERIREFSAKYPEGSLQGVGRFIYATREADATIIGYHYRAEAYRNADDPRPGVGTAFEPIPGKTPYTRDSEVQNAETAAWGRAIVALGFETKKIASKQEVQARSGVAERKPVAGTGSRATPATPRKDLDDLDAAVTELAEVRGVARKKVLTALEETLGKPVSALGDVEVTMAKARLKAWLEKAQAAA